MVILPIFNFQNVREVTSGMGQVLSENDYPHHIGKRYPKQFSRVARSGASRLGGVCVY
jgi:hypothetical protein